MSVIVKDIEMPKDCYDCPLHDGETGRCNILRITVCDYIPKECPLVEVVMDDLISRQAAIDEIEYELKMINSALDSITLDFNARERLRQRKGEAREILNSIQQLPSVQAEQKKGKWIEDGTHSVVICSQCDASNLWKSPCCPYCGAKMEGEE